jgi:retron-type reverse transcriptase
MNRHLVLGLADAMLSGDATPTSARKRCAKALGADGSWLDALCKSIVRKHRYSWHPESRQAIAASILGHPAFEKIWNTDDRPVLRVYFLPSPKMAPPPLGLERCALPDLPTTGRIAEWLALEPNQLDWFADIQGRNADAVDERLRHYTHRWVAKRSGGHRLLEIPKVRLRQLQRKLLRELLEYVPPHEAAHGFRPRHSCKTNAEPHVGHDVVIRMDLQDFFVSIGHARVEGVFRMLGYPEKAAQVFAGLCTNRVPASLFRRHDAAKYDFELPQTNWLLRKRLLSPHLPQGAPTSPALANLCAFNLDLRLHAAVESMDGHYTRYADDLTFSGGRQLARGANRFIELVTRIVQEEGYAVNFRKTKVMLASRRQQVTGIIVNRKLNLSRRECDELKAMLYNCVRHGPSSQNRAGLEDFHGHLAGRIAHLTAINPERGWKMKTLLDRVTW